MMDREQIIQVSDKINEWIKEIDNSVEKIRKLQSEVESELESQLAEPPALRHGDYGLDSKKNNKINWLYLNNSVFYPQEGRPYECTASHDILLKERVGNIFDDLSAMAEDVKELKLSSPDGTLHLDIELSIDGKYVVFSMINEFNDKQLSLTLPTNIVTKSNIKAFLATALRKAKGESNE